MNYQESLNYIHSLLRFGIKPGLERISALLQQLGNPQDKCRFIHVAGTNGKGSTSTMLSAFLRSAGYKTGLYTSPYVVDFRERIQINGDFIPKEALVKHTEMVKSAAESIGSQPTEFEFITALAFLYFAQEECEFVVLETGLGGRYDATNVIKKPIACAITPIGLDHTAILGETEELIAAEKAGIIKPGCPVAVAFGQKDSVTSVFKDTAEEKNSEISFCDKAEILETDLNGSRFIYKGKEYAVGMMGKHQVQNAATAIETAMFLPDFISEDDIRNGLMKAFVPARLEKISLEPLTLLDGGHNGHAAEALKSAVESLENKPRAIIGMMEDKDIEDYAKLLADSFSEIIAICVHSNPRSISAEKLADIFKKYNPNVRTAADYETAIREADVGKRDVMVCGSLYLAGEIRPLLLDMFR